MPRRPNLLFLYSDEQRWDALGCTGDGRLRTPAIDALAARATLVPRCHVTQPVCTASRASLLTGLWPHQNGMGRNNAILDPAIPCLPELLTPGMWATAHHGKWHLGDEVFAQHGFEEWIATEDTYHDHVSPGRDPRTYSAYDRWLRAVGCRPAPVTIPGREPWIADRFFRDQIHAMPEELSRPAFLAASAARFIREQRDRPWVLYVNFLEPHMPFTSCRDHQYRPADVSLPANLLQRPTSDHSLRARIIAESIRRDGFQRDRDLRGEDGWRRLIARYWGMCSLVDSAVGRILAALEASGAFDDTLIVYTSDHGDHMGSHGLVGKSLPYEEATRVPLVVKLPGQRTAQRLDGALSTIDMVPTLLAALGEPVPAHLPGRSRAEALRRGGRLAEDVFIEWHGDGDGGVPVWAGEIADPDRVRAAQHENTRTIVMADGWRYTRAEAGGDELFDLARDPGELVNRVADPTQRERVAEARRRIAAWSAATGDSDGGGC